MKTKILHVCVEVECCVQCTRLHRTYVYLYIVQVEENDEGSSLYTAI